MSILNAINGATQKVRLLLFEFGLDLSPLEIDFFISKARRDTVAKLDIAARRENLINKRIKAYCPDSYLAELKAHCISQNPSAHFWQWQQLAQELAASVTNLALQYAYQYQWDKELRQSSQKSLWHWARHQQSVGERTVFFEQWGSDGHPYHPNAKAKMGFSAREAMSYSPEFEAQFELHWLAISKEHATLSGESICRELSNAFPKEMADWKEKLKAHHLDEAKYYPLPVHPWQLAHKLKTTFSEFFSEGLLVDVGCNMLVTPTMSFRTVSRVGSSSPHIKLATAIHTTSAMRTVSPGSVYNGPKLSALLKTVLANEKHFNQTLFILNDLGGISAKHSEGKHLSALLRQNPIEHLKQGETAIVLAALFKRSPITNKPLVIEILEASSLSPQAFFHTYCEMLLPGQMTLYLKYGLALEAHQQNTFIVFDENAKPVKHLNRDLGGIRIYRPKLSQQGFLLSLDKSVLIDTDDYSEVSNKFIHATLQSNLHYVIQAIDTHCQGNYKKPLWKVAKSVMLDVLSSLQPQLGKKTIDIETGKLFKTSWPFKSLLRMRLAPFDDSDIYRQADNPLRDA